MAAGPSGHPTTCASAHPSCSFVASPEVTSRTARAHASLGCCVTAGTVVSENQRPAAPHNRVKCIVRSSLWQRDPAACHRLVQRITGQNWTKARAAGVASLLARFLQECGDPDQLSAEMQ